MQYHLLFIKKFIKIHEENTKEMNACLINVCKSDKDLSWFT
jgi:hypothetical protein